MGTRGMGARGIGARAAGATAQGREEARRALEGGGCSGEEEVELHRCSGATPVEEEVVPEATSEPVGAAEEAGAALVAIGNGSAVVTHSGCGRFGSGSRSLHA